jgi:hypothetical protein
MYDFDCVIWDTVGGAYTSESMKKAAGGSEKEIVQLAQGLARSGFRVCCYNQTSSRFVDGLVTWRTINANETPSRCRTLIIQRYSSIPDSSQVLPDRMVVRATDVYGPYYDHLSALNTLCVSSWQAEEFRNHGFPVFVIPAMLDDDYYELSKVEKVKGRFIYASAWMKGLKETIPKWISLRERFPKEMAGCELHVTSPGYGHERQMIVDDNVIFIGDLPPRELAKYMATCEGLFYVNTFPETLGVVASLMSAVGGKTHILAKNGAAGLVEATVGGVTEDESEFDSVFIGLLGQDAPRTPKDFRVSTVLPQWLAVLKLTAPVAEHMRAGLTDKERAILDRRVPFSQAIIDAKEEPKMNSTPTVCLVMLAKNAESTLKRALDSVRGFVDYAVFQFDDEGSSKKMREIILELWPNHETSIPVEFSYAPWVNFSVNRNKLLATAKEACAQATYVLTLDADDEFAGLSTFDKKSLNLDSYSVLIDDGGVQYERLMLWRADRGYHYEGPAHEFLTSKTSGLTTATLPNVRYKRYGQTMPPNATPAEQQLFLKNYREKYLRDVRLFVAELERNPEDTRSAYYLGQSLEDASCGTDPDLQRRALRVYAIRAKMGGFIQEKFVAQMKIGKISKGLKLTEEAVVEAFEEASRIAPERATEAFYEILLYYNNEGNSKEKAVAASKRCTPSRVVPSGFIVDASVYAWRYDFQLAIALCYTGAKAEAKVLFENLLTTAPPYTHDIIRYNLTFCVPPVKVEAKLLEELKAVYGSVAAAKATQEEGFDFRVGRGPPELGATLETPARSAPVPWFTPKNV